MINVDVLGDLSTRSVSSSSFFTFQKRLTSSGGKYAVDLDDVADAPWDHVAPAELLDAVGTFVKGEELCDAIFKDYARRGELYGVTSVDHAHSILSAIKEADRYGHLDEHGDDGALVRQRRHDFRIVFVTTTTTAVRVI